jgi:DNA polymerase III alpha subunit (gram-positive type)
LLGLLAAYKKRVSAKKAITILDAFNNTGGLLLASWETGDASWINKIPGKIAAPPLRLGFSRRFLLLILSLVFFLAGLFMPVINFASLNNPPMNLKNLKQKALLKIETLEEQKLIEEKKADELKNTLNNLTKTANKNDPSDTFEAFDRLDEKMENIGDEAVKKAAKQLQEMKKMQSLSDKLKNTDRSDSKAFESALEDLKKNLQKSSLKQNMPGKTSAQLDKSLNNLSAKTSDREIAKAVEQLQSYIKSEQQRINKMMQNLKQVKIIDQKTFEKLKQQGKIKPATKGQKSKGQKIIVAPSTQKGAANGSSSSQSGNSDKKGGGGKTSSAGIGKGGITRGGGTAPLNFDRKSSKHGVDFKDEKLPDPAAVGPAISIGIGVTAPLVEEQLANTTESETFNSDNTKKTHKSDQIILPRHRGAVKSFFDR